MNTQLSNSNKSIMEALLPGPGTSFEVAGKLGVSVPKVTGSLASLKKLGFVEVLPTKELALTKAGIQVLTPAQAVIEYATPAAVATATEIAAVRRKGDVKEAAQKLVDSIPAGSKRAVYMKAFMEQLGMSQAGASTYHNNLVGKKGRWK